MIQTIIAQIFVAAINIYIAFTPKRKNIYAVTFLFNLSNFIMYLFKQDWIAVAAYISITIRSLLYIWRDSLIKNKAIKYLIPFLCIAAQLAVGLVGVKNSFALIPVMVPAYVCFYMWFITDLQRLRVNNAVCNGLWCLYNGYSNLYIAAFARAVVVSANIVAYVKNKRQANNII